MARHLIGLKIYIPDHWTDEQVAIWLLQQLLDSSSPIHEWALTRLATAPEFEGLHRGAASGVIQKAALEAKEYIETVVSVFMGPGGSVVMITHFVGEGRYGAAAMEGVALIPFSKIFSYLASTAFVGAIVYRLSIAKGVAIDFSVGMLAPLFRGWNASQLDNFYGGLVAATAGAKTHDEAIELARKYFRERFGANGDLWFDAAYSAARNPNWRQSPYDSKALRRALGLVDGDGYFGHHIIAGHIDGAAEGRRLLDYYQIGINSHYNGVALTFPEHYLRRLHTNENMRRISERLRGVVQGITDWNLARQRLLTHAPGT